MSVLVDIDEAIEEIRHGRMVILVDDEDRENEGDLTMAAEKVTPEAVNFMTKWSMSQIRLRIQGLFSIGSGGQAKWVDDVRLRLDFFESLFEVIFGVLPFEWLGDLIIKVLKLKYGGFKGIEVWKVVWCQNLALQN